MVFMPEILGTYFGIIKSVTESTDSVHPCCPGVKCKM